MRKSLIAALFGAALAAGCRPAPQAAAEPPMSLKELMGHAMQRNATQLWAWTAYVSDSKGDRYTAPQTEAEWLDAESDALTMQVLAKALRDPAYRIDAAWSGHVDVLAQAVEASANAAEHKNFADMLKAGDRINAACVACHMTYVPELEGVQPTSRQLKAPGVR
jgi:hypothetical protein